MSSPWRVRAPLLSNVELLPGVHLLWARAPQIAAAARPGQFLTFRCGDGSDPLMRRPLSIHRVGPEGETLALLYAVVGRGTGWLSRRTEGQTLDLLGPLGRGFEIGEGSRNLLLLAGGIGVAPLMFLAQEAMAQGRSTTLLLGWRTASQLYPSHLLPSGLKVVVATEDGSVGHKGMVTDLVPKLAPAADQVFACGPLAMYRSLAARADAFAQRPVQVLLEAVLGCGVGACLGCGVETRKGLRRVCRDGPVFELGEVLWERMASAGVGRAIS